MVFYEDPSYRGIATREVVRVGTQAAQFSGTGGGGPGSYDNLIYPEKAVKFLAMRAQVDPGLGVVTQFEEPDGTRSELRYFGPRRVRIFDDQDLDPASVHADTPREVETDGHGQLVQVVETYRGGENNAALRTERTSYAWDALGNLVQLRRHGSASDGSGDIIKTQIYDTIGQKVQIDDLNAGTWTFGYDDAGNLAWHQDPRGNRFAFGYDDGNRLIWEDCVSGPTCGPEVEVRYHYDSPATWENGEGFFPAGIVDHDGIEIPQTHVLGRLAWVEDRGRRTYTSYNARGEVVAQAKNLHGFAMLPDANAPEVLTPMLVGDAELFYVSTRELDDVGRVRHETLVDGTELNYTYDRRGLLATLSGVYQDRALTFVQAVTYDLQGRRVAARLGGGIRETKTYNQMGRTLEVLRVLVDETETTTAEVLHLAYTYDRVGRLTSQTDLRADGLRLDGTSAPTVKTYTYDGQGQLLTSEERTVADDILVRRMRYDYDVLGNIVEKHTTRCMETTSPCTEQDDPPDEYYTHWFGTATYHGDQFVSADGGDGNTLTATYDLAGNMETLAVTRGGQPYFTHTYTWDEQNRLASAVGTGQLFHGGQGVVAVAGYTYDNGGARIAALRAKTFVGVELEETLYVDPSFEIRNGEYTTYIHDAKGRLARLISHGPAAPPDITWLHGDHLGSTTVVTSDDGTFIEETKYLPYGAVQSTHRPDLGIPYEPYGFTGKEAEPDFGILYFGARYYNPHLARWISPDPLFLHVTSESAEKSQNVYCYASNDPVNMVDPDGMADEDGFWCSFSLGVNIHFGTHGNEFSIVLKLQAGYQGEGGHLRFELNMQYGEFTSRFLSGNTLSGNVIRIQPAINFGIKSIRNSYSSIGLGITGYMRDRAIDPNQNPISRLNNWAPGLQFSNNSGGISYGFHISNDAFNKFKQTDHGVTSRVSLFMHTLTSDGKEINISLHSDLFTGEAVYDEKKPFKKLLSFSDHFNAPLVFKVGGSVPDNNFGLVTGSITIGTNSGPYGHSTQNEFIHRLSEPLAKPLGFRS